MTALKSTPALNATGIEARCAATGMRMTDQRRVIARVLAERNTLVHRLRQGRKTIGFAVSRMAADQAEILSIAVEPKHRGRGLSRNLLLTHLGHLAGRGVRTVFLEVEENNQPARRLYHRAGFAVTGRRERYYRQDGEQLNALIMRRDLS